MTKDKLKNKIGFQISFILYSGLDPDKGVEQITEIAVDYHNANSELTKLEAIQSYLLEHGANDEDLNDSIHVMKGLKTQEQVDKLKTQRRK